MSKSPTDLRLYALVDPEQAMGRDLAELTDAVISGGATLIQLRHKQASTGEFVAAARAVKAAARGRVPVIVNDRVDVAMAAGADGVHIGQDDMTPADARRLLGPGAIIGQSIKTVAQAGAAPLDLLDYVCIGGVFVTLSKNNTEPPIGLDGLRGIITAIRVRVPGYPVGAIAGINAGNAAEVIIAGADGVAVISALSRADDPAAATRNLRAIVDKALRERSS
jgi:thiamine-phosphate pyrophosphorylase